MDGDLGISKLLFFKTRAYKKDAGSLVASGPRAHIHIWNVFQGGRLMAQFPGVCGFFVFISFIFFFFFAVVVVSAHACDGARAGLLAGKLNGDQICFIGGFLNHLVRSHYSTH